MHPFTPPPHPLETFPLPNMKIHTGFSPFLHSRGALYGSCGRGILHAVDLWSSLTPRGVSMYRTPPLLPEPLQMRGPRTPSQQAATLTPVQQQFTIKCIQEAPSGSRRLKGPQPPRVLPAEHVGANQSCTGSLLHRKVWFKTSIREGPKERCTEECI